MLHIYAGSGADAGIRLSSNLGNTNSILKAVDGATGGFEFQNGGGTSLIKIDQTNSRVAIGSGFGSPLAVLHSQATSEQLRASYDASNYLSVTVSSAGVVDFDATGSAPGVRLGSTSSKKVSFFGATPIVQPSGAAQAALTNSTGGTTDGTLQAVSGTSADASINNNFAELHTLVNALRTALVNLGAIKGSA
jgi:hypothetical protein